MYPFLDGVNAWWGCYLNKTLTPGGGYEYHDWNRLNPDYEHEGQRVADPQIALAFIRRSMDAQSDMAAALGFRCRL